VTFADFFFVLFVPISVAAETKTDENG